MNASLVHAFEMFNRAGKFALKCLEVINFVLKLRDAELAVVEEFKALVAARQSRTCQIKP